MSIMKSLLKGRLTSFLPLPARLAVAYGPRALRAYGDWRGMRGHAAASAKHRTRAAVRAVERGSRRTKRGGLSSAVLGLGGLALGALGGVVAGRLLGGSGHDRRLDSIARNPESETAQTTPVAIR